MRRAVYELRRQGHMDAYREISERLIEWNEYRLSEQESTQSLLQHYAQALYLAGRWAEAQVVYEKLAVDYPESITFKGCLGTAEARIGNRDKAQQISEELKNLDGLTQKFIEKADKLIG